MTPRRFARRFSQGPVLRQAQHALSEVEGRFAGARVPPDDVIEPLAPRIGYGDFAKVDIRVGRVVSAEPFPKARKPAYRLLIDFGPEIGRRKSSAQCTGHYAAADLVGRLVVAVVNFPPRQIGPMMSEVLVLGVPDGEGDVVLLAPDRDVPLGGRMF
jgi:tRNA-binding protein